MGNACGCGGGGKRKKSGVDLSTCNSCENPVFQGLDISAERKCAFDALLKRMDAVSSNHRTSVSLLSGLQRHKTWDIYLFFSDWPGPVSAACVARLVRQFEEVANEWVSDLRFGKVTVRPFGFVFCKGVETDATFDAAYGKYPTVRGWTDQSEASPWVTSAAGGASTRNMYDPKLDLHTIKVVGNRTGTGATFHPETWDSYRHPRQCVGFQTRFWHGHAEWKAFAHRHYVRVSKVLEDPLKGDFGRNLRVLRHEIGHCFFLDDLYDRTRYPTPLPNTVCPCHPSGHCVVQESDSIMHTGSEKITPLDRAQLRHVWNAWRARAPPTAP